MISSLGEGNIPCILIPDQHIPYSASGYPYKKQVELPFALFKEYSAARFYVVSDIFSPVPRNPIFHGTFRIYSHTLNSENGENLLTLLGIIPVDINCIHAVHPRRLIMYSNTRILGYSDSNTGVEVSVREVARGNLQSHQRSINTVGGVIFSHLIDKDFVNHALSPDILDPVNLYDNTRSFEVNKSLNVRYGIRDTRLSIFKDLIFARLSVFSVEDRPSIDENGVYNGELTYIRKLSLS